MRERERKKERESVFVCNNSPIFLLVEPFFSSANIFLVFQSISFHIWSTRLAIALFKLLYWTDFWCWFPFLFWGKYWFVPHITFSFFIIIPSYFSLFICFIPHFLLIFTLFSNFFPIFLKTLNPFVLKFLFIHSIYVFRIVSLVSFSFFTSSFFLYIFLFFFVFSLYLYLLLLLSCFDRILLISRHHPCPWDKGLDDRIYCDKKCSFIFYYDTKYDNLIFILVCLGLVYRIVFRQVWIMRIRILIAKCEFLLSSVTIQCLGAIHKLRDTKFMIFYPSPPCHRWSHFWDPLPSVTSHILQF